MEININNIKAALHQLNNVYLTWQNMKNEEHPHCTEEDWNFYIIEKHKKFINYRGMLRTILSGYYVNLNENTGLYCIYDQNNNIIVEDK